MTGRSSSEHHAAEGRSDGSPSCGHGRRSPSVLGLSIVSGLNVVSLAFLAYHFAGHPDETTSPPAEQPAANGLMVATPSLPRSDVVGTSETARGNVDLLPSTKRIISIASGFDIENDERDDRQEGGPTTPAAAVAAGVVRSAKSDMQSEHWVQLGALSKETTARRYWSGLKQRHAALLRGREPRYFGPEDVGGSLFHIRLGPMDGDAAADLCEALTAKNADCFRIGPESGMTTSSDSAAILRRASNR